MAYLTTTGSGQPVLILKEGTTRSRGKEAQRNNIMAARVIGEVLKTTLGPRGMDKMLIDNLGDITITNDGAAILNEIDVEHPAAKMMVEIAKTQVDMEDRKTLLKVALTSMGSKAVGSAKEHFAEIAIEAVKQIAEKRGDKMLADIDNIQLIKKTGKSLLETQLIRGIIVDKEAVDRKSTRLNSSHGYI